jgi:hypothetical protein
MENVMISSILLLGLFGCGEDDKETQGDSSSETTNEEEETQDDGPNPTIVEADAWCYVLEAGDTVEQWLFKATATDPQGVDTLESFTQNAISFQDIGGTEISTVAIVCDPAGECTSSANGASLGVGCSNPTNFQAVFTVSDQDGNVSAPVTVTGRLGSSADGK